MWVARVMDQPYPHVVQSQVTRQAGNKSVQVEDEFGSCFLCTVGKLGIVCSYSHFWRCMYVHPFPVLVYSVHIRLWDGFCVT